VYSWQVNFMNKLVKIRVFVASKFYE